MRIGIDIDGVLANFYVAYERLHIEVSGEDRFGDQKYPVLPKSWNWPNDNFGYSKEVTAEVWKIIRNDPNFWRQLQSLPDIDDLLNWQGRHEHDIYFVTDRMGPQAKAQTEHWLTMRGIYGATVLLSSQKGLCCKALKLQRYVDDKAENILDVMRDSPETEAFLLDRPYNQHVEANRVYALGAFLSLPYPAIQKVA